MATKVVISFEVDNAGAVNKIKQVRGELDDVPRSTEKATTGLKNLKAAFAAVAASAAAMKVADIFRDIVMVGAKFETLSIQLRSVMGSIEQGEAAMAWIKQFTKETPFELDQVVQAFIRMKAMGLDPASGALQAVADAASYTGTGFEGLSRITLALGQAWTKNKLQGEELLQLMEAQVPAADLLGEALGVSTAEIYKMASAGKIGRDEILLLIKAMGEMYSGASQQQMQTFTGMWSNLKDQIAETYDLIARAGALDTAKKGVELLSRALEALTPALAHVAATIRFAFSINPLKAFEVALLGMDVKIKALAYKILNAWVDVPDIFGGGEPALKAAEIAFGRLQDAVRKYQEAFSNTWRDPAKEFREFLDMLNGTGAGKLGAGGGGGGGVNGALRTLAERAKEAAAAVSGILAPAINEAVGVYLSVGDSAERFNDIIRGSDNLLFNVFQKMPGYVDEAEDSFDVLGQSFSDLLGKGFMGELESFADVWDAVWQDLAKSMVGIIGGALEKIFSGEGSFKDLFAKLEGNWAAGIAGIGMAAQAYQTGGGGWGGALMGAMGGAMAGAVFGPIGMAVGAVVGGIVGALGKAAENPETLVQQLGLDTGHMLTRGHQGIGPEMRELWIKQQQGIMRSYIKSYREILRMFEDQSLFELIGQTPTFNTTGWQGIGANDLAKYLEQEFWPTAFMNMFRDAISAGLEGFGVTSATIDQLWTELEALPGPDRMGALSTYVSSLVGLSDLMEDMNWDAILDAVSMNSLETFMAGFDGIAASIDTLMMAMDDMSLLERAEKAQEIEGLILQIRQAEINYLKQLDQLQKGINQSIGQQLENLQLGGMPQNMRNAYYQQRIAEIMDTLRSGGVTSPEQLQQLMADLQRYTGALASGLGESLYAPMSPWDDQTWADWISGILTEAQGFSDEYFDRFRDEIQAANQALIDALYALIDALTNFGEPVGGGAEPGVPRNTPESAQTSVNVYVSGDWGPLRPFVRAEIRDAMGGGAYPVS